MYDWYIDCEDEVFEISFEFAATIGRSAEIEFAFPLVVHRRNYMLEIFDVLVLDAEVVYYECEGWNVEMIVACLNDICRSVFPRRPAARRL